MATLDLSVMASWSATVLDSAELHQLCHEGDLKKIKDFVEDIDPQLLGDSLANKKGVFGYTPLHEAVASGKPEILKFLLEGTNNANVNCRSRNGYTPLHLAASKGHSKCVRELLEHGADISSSDVFGKTPVQRAELSCIVKILRSEGEF